MWWNYGSHGGGGGWGLPETNKDWSILGTSLGGMLKATGLLQEGEWAVTAGRANRDMAYNNAVVMDQNAQAAEAEAAVSEGRHRQDVKRLLGAQRVSYAKSGVTSDGTPTDIETESMIQGELDSLLIRYNGATRAHALRTQAAYERYRGEMEYSAAKNKKDGNTLGAIGSLLGTMGDVFKMKNA
jgi:hypothetical protein